MEKGKEDALREVPATVIQMLENFLDAQYGQRNYKYQIQLATKKGDNYMGVVYRVTIRTLNSSENMKTIILKVSPQNPEQRKQFFARDGFLREALAYEEFLPLLNDFQKGKGLAVSDTFFEYPECYFTSTEDLNETICMSDLQTEGFFMHNRFEPLTIDQALYVVGIYGKLHAISLVLKDQSPDKMNSLKNIPDILEERKNDVQLNDYFESLKCSALESVNNVKDRIYWKKLRAYFNSGSFYNLMLHLLDASSSEPYSVICHGDSWINNIMFKKENDKIVDARLIDWQIMRYSSPVTDLMYFLMPCTTREFRQKYFKEILDSYYCATRKHITRLGSDAQKIYSRSAFDKQFKEKGAIGLLLSMIILPILTTKGEDVPDLQKLSETVSAAQSTDAMTAGFVGVKSLFFNERMRGIIMDSIDWNLI